MNFYQKTKIKKFFKEKWGWFLGTGLFLLIGGTIAIVGFSLNGWSLAKWLHSPYAFTTLVFIIVGLYCLIMIFILYKKSTLIK